MNILKEVEIFGVGAWQGQGMKKPFNFTKDLLSRIVANTSKLTNRKMPLKLGHTDKQIFEQTDGQPALGWLENVKLKGEKIVADLTNIPNVLMTAIEKGLYRQVSVELGSTKDIGPHVTGLAILGADLPAVKTLKDLDLYFSGNAENVDTIEGGLSLCFTEPKLNGVLDMTTEKQEFDFEARFAEREKELQKREAAIAAYETKLQEEKLEGLFSSKQGEFLELFEAQVKEGKLMPHVLDKIKEDLEGQKASFSESSELTLSFATIKELSEGYASLKQKEELEQKEELKEEGSIQDRVEKKVFSVMESTGKEYQDALEVVFMANKELAQEYFEASLKEYQS
jgi:hypothetical protein